MECTVENDMLPLYNEMKNFDFNKPFSVTTEQVSDSYEVYSIAEDTNNGNERNDNPTVSVYFQEENTHTMKNKENFMMQTDNCDITRFNKTQESSDLCTPSWILDLFHTKETQCSLKPHTAKNQSTSSVSGELSYREGNSSNSFLMSEPIFSSKSSYVNCQPVSSVSVLTCNNRNLSCDSNLSKLGKKLNFVSMNLINTLRAWSYYSVVVKSKSVTAAKKIDTRRKYQTAKNSYFQSSREIVEKEILPQSNNIYFNRNFINETTRLAIAKNVFCTINDVECVYNDLLAWVFYMRNPVTALNVKQNSQNQMTGNSEFPETSPLRQTLKFNGSISNNMDQLEHSMNERVTQGSKTCLLSYGGPGNELSININTEILNNINKQNNFNNLLQNNNVHINNQCNPDQVTRFNQTTNISSNWNNSLTCETLDHDAVSSRQSPTRSTSRDSGFMSPVTEQNDTERTNQEPYITHVTSLNPRATYILPGNCMVCGRITSKKCLGCYNIYYCSNNCQSLHWIKHKDDCKNSVR